MAAALPQGPVAGLSCVDLPQQRGVQRGSAPSLPRGTTHLLLGCRVGRPPPGALRGQRVIALCAERGVHGCGAAAAAGATACVYGGALRVLQGVGASLALQRRHALAQVVVIETLTVVLSGGRSLDAVLLSTL